ncbi:LysR family transcriptional regulator [Halotia wernerae UHCC 0503]|nr:LysR family transcriptional regulator [Halotia wernerae UHCC 0503]
MLHGRMLRYLDEIVRSGSIRKASARLNVASSAINRQLLALEAELGAPLFERLPRGLRLTAAGEMLIAHVRQTLKDHDRLRRRIEGLKGLRHGKVAIGTVSGLASGLLSTVIADFRAKHPFIRVTVRNASLDALIAAVLSGDLDLVLAYNLPRHPRLRVLADVGCPLGAVVAPDHPLARETKLRLADCLDYPLVLPDSSVTIRMILDEVIPPQPEILPVLESNSTDLLKKLALEAPHLTFLNEVDVAEELRWRKLVFIPVQELAARPQSLILAQRTKAPLEGLADLLVRALKAELDRLYRPQLGRGALKATQRP